MSRWLELADGASGGVETAVFVPAVMGAGVVLSIATLLRDLVAHGRRELVERRAGVRAPIVADWVVRGPGSEPWRAARPAAPRTMLLAGLAAGCFALYVAIGTTGNFLRRDGYVHDIAWMWGGSLAVAALAAAIAIACVRVGLEGDRAPIGAWNVVAQTPLVGRDGASDHRLSQHALVIASTLATGLMVLATWPHVLDPLDRRIASLIDHSPTEALHVVGDTLGSTELTLALAVGVGVATLRCRRFAAIYVIASVMTLIASFTVRLIVSRPRPEAGPRAGELDSFPSGHMVQATLIAVLLPLAVHELTRSRRWRRVSRLILTAGLVVVAVVAVSGGRHHATDVIAGAAIGLSIGSWGRLALEREAPHRRCRRCRYRSDAP